MTIEARNNKALNL